jgi:hypothetical protein
MFFLRWLNAIGGGGTASNSRDCKRIRPALEHLEDRITPITPFPTVMNVSVQIIPNLSNLTVTEKVTANVSFEGGGSFQPPIAPVQFNLNNQQQSINSNGNGQATATFTLPLATLLTSQTLLVSYPAHYANPSNLATLEIVGSYFAAPLYTNFDNLLFPATLTFGTPTSQQILERGVGGVAGSELVDISSILFNTVQGETDAMGLLSFSYNDPGTITSFQVLGLTLPGRATALPPL